MKVDRTPLWVAKQHGRSSTAMLRAYEAWAEGAIEADIEAIQHAMIQFTGDQASRYRGSVNWDSPQAPVRSVVPQPTTVVETARHDHLSVDLPAATFCRS